MKTYKMRVNGNDYVVAVRRTSEDIAQVKIDGVEYNIEVDSAFNKVNKPLLKPVPENVQSVPVAVHVARPAAGGEGTPVKSPLPGVILDVFVKEGDSVKAGQKLMMLEAMKMENNIEAESDGIVKKIYVSKGGNVLEGDTLITIA